MSNEILLLSGPNLDLLGTRNPEIYGTTTLAEHVERFTKLASDAGFSVRHVQSNFEGDLIEAVHGARESAVAIVINAGALTHSSWALADALDTFNGIKWRSTSRIPRRESPFVTSARSPVRSVVPLPDSAPRATNSRSTPFGV